MTYRDLIYGAARIARTLGNAGRGLSDAETRDALDCLNSLSDAWATERLQIHAVRMDEVAISANQQSYTIGKDPEEVAIADFDIDRPERIESANLLLSTDARAPIAVITEARDWAAIPVKSVSGPPTQLYFDQHVTPFARISFFPVPDATYTVELYASQLLSQVDEASLDDVIDLARGYRRALEYNLAIELAARFPRAELTPMAMEIARTSKAAIKSKNSRPRRLTSDTIFSGSTSDFDYRTGR